MSHSGESQATAEILAVDSHSASPNGFGATTTPTPMADNPAILIAAAFIGGFLLARLVRRLGS